MNLLKNMLKWSIQRKHIFHSKGVFIMPKKFEMGQVVMTSGISNAVEKDISFGKFVNDCLLRFAKCDWGYLCKDDKKLNDANVDAGHGMILASYKNRKDGREIWIQTVDDRSYTTILFPSEY